MEEVVYTSLSEVPSETPPDDEGDLSTEDSRKLPRVPAPEDKGE